MEARSPLLCHNPNPFPDNLISSALLARYPSVRVAQPRPKDFRAATHKPMAEERASGLNREINQGRRQEHNNRRTSNLCFNKPLPEPLFVGSARKTFPLAHQNDTNNMCEYQEL